MRRRHRRRWWAPARPARGRHHPGPGRARRRARGQGHVPPRQDLRRRPHHRRAAPARGPRPRPRPTWRRGRWSATVRALARRARQALPPPPRAGPVRRGGHPGATWTPPWSTWPARRAPRCWRATPSPAAAEPDGDGVTSTWPTASAPLRARWAIAADGMWSPHAQVPRRGPPGYLGEWHAFRQYVSGRRRPTASRDLYVSFEPDILPGYFWSFPLPGGRANIGFGVQRGGKVAVRRHEARCGPTCSTGPHVRDLLGPDATPEGRTGRGPSRPASTAWCSPPGAPCSWATPRPPAT